MVRRDEGGFQLLVGGLIVVLVLVLVSAVVGAVGSPVQIFADEEDSTAATPTPQPEESQAPPTPMTSPSGSSGSDSGSQNSGSQGTVDAERINISTAEVLVNESRLEGDVEQAIIDYRLQNDIDENTLDSLMTEGNTADQVELLASHHSEQLAENESAWGPYSWDEYNWEALYEQYELRDVCSMSSTNAQGESYVETYERGDLVAVTQVDAAGLNHTEIVNRTMTNWENDPYQFAKLEYESASRIAVGVSASDDTTSVYVAAAMC